MIDFSSVTEIYLGGQAVTSIALNGQEIWTAGGGEDLYTLRFTPETNGSITFSDWKDTMNVEYSKDMKTWTSLITANTTVTVQAGETLYVRGDNPNGLSTSGAYFKINPSVKTIVSGDVMSLIYPKEEQNTKVIPNNYCFSRLFYEASKIDIDENFKLSATKLTQGCYLGMFYRCTRLTTAPELPATTIVSWCYNSMFQNCTSLTAAPELPATTMQTYCYGEMFKGCTALTTAPELPATTLVTNCYRYMFNGCTKLNYIKVGATGWSESSYTPNWVAGVASSGTFVKPASTSIPTSEAGIPSGWTVMTPEEYEQAEQAYTLRFTPETSGNITFSGLPSGKNVEYSTDKNTWTSISVTTTVDVPVQAGETLYVRGNNPSGLSTGVRDYFNIKPSVKTIVSGDVMSLIYPTYRSNTKIIPNNYCFYCLFRDASNIDIDNNFKLSATKLTQYCYAEMFFGCTALTTAPELPAMVLADYCYYGMFYLCTSLSSAPELPAMALAYGCYESMFSVCTSLTTAPDLPATTLEFGCYYRMFETCQSLTEAPYLPAETLAEDCYKEMFSGCWILNYIRVGATYWDESYANDWVNGVSSTGTFSKPFDTDIPTGTSGIPEGWEVDDIF